MDRAEMSVLEVHVKTNPAGTVKQLVQIGGQAPVLPPTGFLNDQFRFTQIIQTVLYNSAIRCTLSTPAWIFTPNCEQRQQLTKGPLLNTMLRAVLLYVVLSKVVGINL